jgi:hypothetical protein
LFHNLRATRETDPAEVHPLCVVCVCIGNTERIAQKNDVQVPDDEFALANDANTASDSVQPSQKSGHHRLCTERENPGIPGFSSDSPAVSEVGQYPPRGLETESGSSNSDNKLGQTSFQSGAESGAVSTETALPLTAELLAAALMALSPVDRARLAVLLTGEQPGQTGE